MGKQAVQHKLSERILAQTIFYALEMFSDVRYKDFLRGQAGKLEEKWFKWFAGEWRIARTIKQGKLDEVCRYLNTKFREALQRGENEEAVDIAAVFIRDSGLSAQPEGKQPVLPLSLVSKVGFLLCPAKIVPFDGYSLEGLNKLLGENKEPRLYSPTYRDFVNKFNAKFNMLAPEIEAELKQSWVSTLAQKIGYAMISLNAAELKRKVFDNYLMYQGDYAGDPLSKNKEDDKEQLAASS